MNLIKALIALFGLMICFVCYPQEKRNSTGAFVPDSTVKSVIKLSTHRTEDKMLAGLALRREGVFNVAMITNSDCTEYLKIRQSPGSIENSFGFFEIGKMDLKSKMDTSFKKLPWKYFFTESGVHLGITKAELIRIKGRKFTSTSVGELVTLSYQLTDQSSGFLRRYNMPAYIAKFNFLSGRLIMFSFGFDNE